MDGCGAGASRIALADLGSITFIPGWLSLLFAAFPWGHFVIAVEQVRVGHGDVIGALDGGERPLIVAVQR